jgi:hypothetical protein
VRAVDGLQPLRSSDDGARMVRAVTFVLGSFIALLVAVGVLGWRRRRRSPSGRAA